MPASHLQHTVTAPVTLTGLGVHSGAMATLVIKPASADHGIVFVRSDITDRDNRIPARYDLVADTRLCTVLKNKQGASVSTIEHVMSALTALGIDNAEIDIDGPEVPIMDGSAVPFVAALDTVGRRALKSPRRVIKIVKAVTVEDGDKAVILAPSDETLYSFAIAFDNPVIGRQTFCHTADEAAYRQDIAFARTFGFLHEVEALRAAGLARGGSLDNAIVVEGDKVLNPGGLRSPTEFVRHKILDAIGDLALARLPLIAHYHGDRAGHAMNNRILHALFADPSAYAIVEMQAPATAKAPSRRPRRAAAARPTLATPGRLVTA